MDADFVTLVYVRGGTSPPRGHGEALTSPVRHAVRCEGFNEGLMPLGGDRGQGKRLASAVAACDQICSPRWWTHKTERLVLTGCAAGPPLLVVAMGSCRRTVKALSCGHGMRDSGTARGAVMQVQTQRQR